MNGIDVTMPREIEAIILDDVIDITKLKLKSSEVLVEVKVSNDTGLIIPSTVKNSSITKSRYTIISVGKAVKEYEIGDVLLDFNDDPRVISFINYKKKAYIVISDYHIKFATTADNLKN